jgi:uncharacterized protein YndB with AHSA1/START domain
MKLIKILLSLLLCLLGIVALAYGAGYFLPAKHTASRSVELKATPETVFNTVADIKNALSWRTSLQEIKMLPASDGMESWTEVQKGGDTISFRMKSKTPPSRIEIEVINDSNFGGVWVGTFEPTASGGTRVTFTENGEIYNPLFRTMAKLFFDMGATLEQYLGELSRKLGENPPIQK